MFRDFQAIRGPAGCGDDALSRTQQRHELAAVRDAALLVDVAHMSLEGALGDEQLLHDGRAVLALGHQRQDLGLPRGEAGVLGQLTAETGRPAPTPLASLAGKPVRFDQVTDKAAMRTVVTEFLR